MTITLCVFEDCHAGEHGKCRMGTATEDRVLLFCSCSCHVKRKPKQKKETSDDAECS